MQGAIDRSASGRKFVHGRIRGKDVIVGVLGVGLVNAASGTSDLIIRTQPRCVILCGAAGGIRNKVRVGDVFIGEKVVNYDYGAWVGDRYELRPTRPPSPLLSGEGPANPLFFPASPVLLKAAGDAAGRTHLPMVQYGGRILNPSPRVLTGVIASMDSFSSSESFNKRVAEITGCSALEMEGAAVAQVCYQQGVPFLIVRGISDLAGTDADETYLHLRDQAARHAEALVLKMLEIM